MAFPGVDPLDQEQNEYAIMEQLGALWVDEYGGTWGGTRDPVHFEP